jgi:hypothetical protein
MLVRIAEQFLTDCPNRAADAASKAFSNSCGMPKAYGCTRKKLIKTAAVRVKIQSYFSPHDAGAPHPQWARWRRRGCGRMRHERTFNPDAPEYWMT